MFHQVLRKFDKTEFSHYSEMDFKSIMMYARSDCFVYYCSNTKARYSTVGEITEEGQDIPENQALSDRDKAYIVLNYPRSVPHEEAPEWTVEYALQVVGVENDVREVILSASHPTDIRNAFIRWAQVSENRSLS